jgi:phosphatidylserine/phosphatidylglycerophosphate/cardiolipin synthase-like enzyme
MRVDAGGEEFRVRAISGTRVVLMALDMTQPGREGLRGFAIKREEKGKSQEWLRGIKYFEALVPHPEPKTDYSSRDQPFQTFLWSDYEADPGLDYEFTIVALCGDIHAMEERLTLNFSITTEPEESDGHSVWFNRGAIASHAFAANFNNKALTDDMVNNVSVDGKLLDDETRWLSRGLAEACLNYINSTTPSESLRVCAYEFTYQPILLALKRALHRGVDVQIVYHDTKKENDENRKAISIAGLPDHIEDKQVLFPRTRTAIPHNKFIVKIKQGHPVQVWTGSTNFTDSGFYGQTNVGHLVKDGGLAERYLEYWSELSKDPVHSEALANAEKLTPKPSNVLSPGSTSAFYSPRVADNMLDWYAQRITDSGSLIMMTIPFNVADTILNALGTKRDSMRLVILEDQPSAAVEAAEKQNEGKLAFSNGAIIGKTFIKYNSPVGGAKVAPIPNSDLDKWFLDEELDRPTNAGHVFFVHSKVLIVDPLSEDPLVCSGSANFSKNSLTANDENMLLIRGDKRVADIYLTELDRIFRHFYARDVLNRTAAAGEHFPALLLDPTDTWITANFRDGSYKNSRRLLFFPDAPRNPWSSNAAADPDVFADEQARVNKARDERNARAKLRRTDGARTADPRDGSSGPN